MEEGVEGGFSLTRRFDVVLAGYYGFGNLGDELLAESAVALLQKNGIDRGRIAILSANPADTSKQMGIAAFDRWKLSEIIKVIKSSRSLLLGGGGLFQDATSARSSLYYWGLLSIARLCGTVPWAVGQSIGPLRSPLAIQLTKNAMTACVFRGVRDERSLEYLKLWRLAGRLSPDLVVGLEVKKALGTGRLLLLNLRPGYDALAEQAARAAQKAAEAEQRKIRCIALSKADEITIRHFIDKKVIKSLESNEIILTQTLRDFEKAAADCSHAIGMRLHFIILSFLSGLRISAVPYDPKVESFSLLYNIPVMDKNSGKITFSEPRSGEEDDGSDAETLLRLFRDGVADVLGETEWTVPK